MTAAVKKHTRNETLKLKNAIEIIKKRICIIQNNMQYVLVFIVNKFYSIFMFISALHSFTHTHTQRLKLIRFFFILVFFSITVNYINLLWTVMEFV
eukprot:m.110508 g.110508  ORF g.110508 m.110508 type:complete len:96 (-) comp12748_c0_seq4:339-626(-)